MIVCLYDLERFGGGIVVDLLKTHSRVLVGGHRAREPVLPDPDELLAMAPRQARSRDRPTSWRRLREWCYDATTGST